MSLFRAALAASILSTAPMQCGHTTDVELREDETPGDALWQLAQRFEGAHDAAGERRTLEYLVERYPSSRWVPAARQELDKLGGAPSDSSAPAPAPAPVPAPAPAAHGGA